jgi:threonyl-tRNA synthetase
MWDRAAALLADVLESTDVPYEEAPGEAAFYGPKIDVQVADEAGREASMSTIQIDFYMPAQFGLQYIGPDGARHRPVMVHRSIVGSMERAIAHLIEVHGGAFPPWLAPVQLVILPVSEAELGPAEALGQRAAGRGLRARVSQPGLGSLGARIRAARLVPYQAVIGPSEAAAGQVALRLRDGRRLDPRPGDDALARIAALIDAHHPGVWEEEIEQQRGGLPVS